MPTPTEKRAVTPLLQHMEANAQGSISLLHQLEPKDPSVPPIRLDQQTNINALILAIRTRLLTAPANNVNQGEAVINAAAYNAVNYPAGTLTDRQVLFTLIDPSAQATRTGDDWPFTQHTEEVMVALRHGSEDPVNPHYIVDLEVSFEHPSRRNVIYTKSQNIEDLSESDAAIVAYALQVVNEGVNATP